MAFISLGLIELIHSFNVKSKESIFKVGIFKNKYLIGAFILGVIMQVGVVSVPVIADKFKLVCLNSNQWIYTILISIFILVIMEIQKLYNQITIKRNQIYTPKKVSQN